MDVHFIVGEEHKNGSGEDWRNRGESDKKRGVEFLISPDIYGKTGIDKLSPAQKWMLMTEKDHWCFYHA